LNDLFEVEIENLLQQTHELLQTIMN